jgi:hypothetical protein
MSDAWQSAREGAIEELRAELDRMAAENEKLDSVRRAANVRAFRLASEKARQLRTPNPAR